MGKNSFWILYDKRGKMKFKVTYLVGESLRDKIIIAESLDQAEKIADTKFKKWQDIICLSLMRRNK